jgi:HNH endonuclease/AP2 domain
MITQSRLQSLLSYNPETGIFVWRLHNSKRTKNSSSAGCLNKDTGYIQIKIDGHLYRAHRLAWFYVYGNFPIHQIDHINGNRSDNRIENLREATHLQNQHNQTKPRANNTGYKGVSFYAPLLKYRARIKLKNKEKHLGYFDTPEEAYEAYCNAAKSLHGDFARIA